MMAPSLEFNLVPKLMEWPLGSSRGEVSSIDSRRTSRPTLGSRSSLDRAMPEQVVAQCGWFVELGVVGAGWPCSLRVPSVGRSGR